MYFSGDPSARKTVDLRGRSSRESDAKFLIEKSRLERKRRQDQRAQMAAAVRIQKFFRGWKDVQKARSMVRQKFYTAYGANCQIDWSWFGANSDFLRQLLFFFNAKDPDDTAVLLKACNLVQQVSQSGSIMSLHAGLWDGAAQAVAIVRTRKIAYICLKTLHENRDQWKSEALMPSTCSTIPLVVLLETVVCLVDPQLPWACSVVGYLQHREIFTLLRNIITTGVDVKKMQHSAETLQSGRPISSLERIISSVASHVGQYPCNCMMQNPKCSFSSQILSIPFLWHHLPHFKESFRVHRLGKHYIRQIACFLPSLADVLPTDIAPDYPSYVCILGNMLEAERFLLSDPEISSDSAAEMITVSTQFLDKFSASISSSKERLAEDDSSMDVDVHRFICIDLERQIWAAIDNLYLQKLVAALFRGLSNNALGGISADEVEAVGSICSFLHVTFSTVPHERIMTGLAYRTDIVLKLWNFIKRCSDNQRWPCFSKLHLPEETPGWLLPLRVFCPIYKHMLTFIDNEEFHELREPLSLKDIRSLILILKQALWQVLWAIPSNGSSTQKSITDSNLKTLSLEAIKSEARVVISELLTQLQDWNNRTSFTSASDFYSQEATSETFVSQAILGNTRASELIKLAPFLVPFTSRVKIFTSLLSSFRQRNEFHPSVVRHRFKIRRNQMLEDSFHQLSALSEEDLRGPIRVAFVNEHGVEEAGIDGGGIFKDFMENITHAAFDVQYGLFKETSDHLLYPNPGSGLVHEQHLQYFHFLGSLLGKAMYEGILVDLPFATFFLSKLKQKHNYLNDLPSMDPELYRHLLFLKHYSGDLSELELYFVIVNNEYGEQVEEELLSGGRDMRVTNENVITFIHLVANYRLNYQIRYQSQHFLRGFQQLIPKDWIDMFNEHELQLLISGSVEGMDVDDLRSNTNYNGGYHPDHHVIEMFWTVLKNFSSEHQKKFLKFVTGCSRGPLLGFKYLEPKFCIQRAGPMDGEDEYDRLPTAATCMNLLKLPPYRSIEQLRLKLLYAINAEAGFDLS